MGSIISLGGGSKNIRGKSKAVKIFVIIAILVALTLGGLLVIKLINDAKNSSNKGKVLTTKDLDNPEIDLSPDTSNASVENLNKQLEAKIDEQISNKENPIDTVKQLSGVLSNTTNQERQDKLTNFLEDFLNNHKDALWFKYHGDKPDQAQVNHWKGELYAYLVYNLKSMMDNQFTDSEGKLVNTKDNQLKYIDLYLSLANDPDSHISKEEQNIAPHIDYEYIDSQSFLELKKNLLAGTKND